jgi:hypothetical protein
MYIFILRQTVCRNDNNLWTVLFISQMRIRSEGGRTDASKMIKRADILSARMYHLQTFFYLSF